MPFKSRWSVDIPEISLPTYLFQSPTAELSSKPILIDAENPEVHLTLHTYREWSKRLAAGLVSRGFKTGDRLLLYSGNTVFFPVVMQGAIMAGGIFSGANPGYVARELAYQLKESGATFLITAEGSIDTALAATKEIGFPTSRVFVMGDGSETFENRGRAVKGIQHWSTLLASESEGAKFAWEDLTTRDQTSRTCVLNFSSGTTSLPKGVEISHRNYVSNCLQTEYLAQQATDWKERRERTKLLNFIPFYHAYGQSYHTVRGPVVGIPVYIMRKFDFIQMLQHIQRYRITDLNLVPPIVVALTKRPEVKDYDLSSVESAGSGAAPLAGETILEFEKMFDHKFQLTQGWGMTEMTCTATGWDPEGESEADKVGELGVNIEGMIVDEEGKELGVGERGEFLVRGPNIMKGYWRKPEATKETITEDGWLRTGDIAIFDEKGYIAIVDRKKELIKVKGNQVAPAELEGVLLEHPDIADAAVVGVTIKGEEVPRAYVVAGANKTVNPEDVASWMTSRVARHKRLLGGVKVVDAVPKNPSGKILRKIVREWAKAEVGDQAKRESRL